MALPTDRDARKAIPVYDFLTGYFPDAFVEVVRVAVAGNQQHNPGERLHWARHKSTDQLNTALRHMMDHAVAPLDTDGCWHLAKAIWRLSAELQLRLEAVEVDIEPPIVMELAHGKAFFSRSQSASRKSVRTARRPVPNPRRKPRAKRKGSRK